MREDKYGGVIDLAELVRKVYSRRNLFYTRVWPITFVVSCFIILCVPRYYTSEAMLAPEMGNELGMGGLGSIASTLGFDLGGGGSGDAINPLLYPNLMEDNGFVSEMFAIRVRTADGEVDTDYYTYLKSHQKSAWWGTVMRWLSRGIKAILPSKKSSGPSTGEGAAPSPYWMSEDDEGVADAIRDNVNFSVDKLTAVITISTKAQDALVAKTLADSAQAHLQQFITKYRTNKARIDEEYYRTLKEQAEQEYLQACEDYWKMADANRNVVLSRYEMELGNLEKEMQMKYNTLQGLAQQLQVAQAKVQERTPAFTVMKGASVPQRPAGPKRMFFVLGMLILATFMTAFLIIRKELLGLRVES